MISDLPADRVRVPEIWARVPAARAAAAAVRAPAEAIHQAVVRVLVEAVRARVAVILQAVPVQAQVDQAAAAAGLAEDSKPATYNLLSFSINGGVARPSVFL